jgi:hypothetical protein
MVVAVLSVLIGVRATVLAGIAVRAIVARRSRDSSWRPSPRGRARCRERSRRADPSHEQPSQRQNLCSVQSQSSHCGAFHLPLRNWQVRMRNQSQTPPPSSPSRCIFVTATANTSDQSPVLAIPSVLNRGVSAESIVSAVERFAVFACDIHSAPGFGMLI